MSTNEGRLIPDKSERELLADIVDSPGWHVFVKRIVVPLAKQRRLDALAQVRKSDLPKAQACLAASESVLESVLGAYEGSGILLPEDMRALRHQTDLTAGAESG